MSNLIREDTFVNDNYKTYSAYADEYICCEGLRFLLNKEGEENEFNK